MEKALLERLEKVTEHDIEEIEQFIELMYNDIERMYERYNKSVPYPKEMFFETFCKLIEDVGNCAFEIKNYVLIKCVRIFYSDENHQFTNEELEEFEEKVSY